MGQKAVERVWALDPRRARPHPPPRNPRHTPGPPVHTMTCRLRVALLRSERHRDARPAPGCPIRYAARSARRATLGPASAPDSRLQLRRAGALIEPSREFEDTFTGTPLAVIGQPEIHASSRWRFRSGRSRRGAVIWSCQRRLPPLPTRLRSRSMTFGSSSRPAFVAVTTSGSRRSVTTAASGRAGASSWMRPSRLRAPIACSRSCGPSLEVGA